MFGPESQLSSGAIVAVVVAGVASLFKTLVTSYEARKSETERLVVQLPNGKRVKVKVTNESRSGLTEGDIRIVSEAVHSALEADTNIKVVQRI